MDYSTLVPPLFEAWQWNSIWKSPIKLENSRKKLQNYNRNKKTRLNILIFNSFHIPLQLQKSHFLQVSRGSCFLFVKISQILFKSQSNANSVFPIFMKKITLYDLLYPPESFFIIFTRYFTFSTVKAREREKLKKNCRNIHMIYFHFLLVWLIYTGCFSIFESKQNNFFMCSMLFIIFRD